MTSRFLLVPITPDIQCWLLTACCALGSGIGKVPELTTLRRAIHDGRADAIVCGLETLCSRLQSELPRPQLELAYALVRCVKTGDFAALRGIVVELVRAFQGGTPNSACDDETTAA